MVNKCHPSILPKYAGCFSSVWALFNNEKDRHYFSLYEKKFDSGNILLQDIINIKKNDTAFSLFHKLVKLSLKNLFSVFYLAIYENNKGKPQDLTKRTYYPRKLPNNGILNKLWSKVKRFILQGYAFPPIFDYHKINKKNNNI